MVSPTVLPSLTLTTEQEWHDYQLLDSGEGERLEKFGAYTLVRPDPQILWSKRLPASEWLKADAIFKRTHQDKGEWQLHNKNIPADWPVHWQDVTALAKLSPFKHTGIFPEQSAHWAWMKSKLENLKKNSPTYQPHILNLFAYTGLASVVGAKTGAKVTHVDASKAAIGWAKRNQEASGLDPYSIRWILDDVIKFVSREIKRGVKYDGIIMDPPVYGHGPTGQTWEFKTSFPALLEMCSQILVAKPLFIVINAYAVSASALTLGNVLSETMVKYPGTVERGELCLLEAHAQARFLSRHLGAVVSSLSISQ